MAKRFLFLLTLWVALAACAPAVAVETQPDLFQDAASSRLTADAAVQRAQLQESMLTATAQAPIVHITETAAAYAFLGTQASINSTQASIDSTATAILWTPTASPIPTTTPSSTQNAPMTSTFAAVQAIQTQTILKVQRDEMTNQARAVFWYAIVIAALFVGIAFAYVHIKRAAFVPAPMNEQGRAHPMLNVLDAIAFDIERSTNGVVGTNQKFLKQLPAITAERQDPVTARSQMVDLATRARLPRRLLEEQNREQLPAGEAQIEYPLPEWSTWMQGWKPGQIALGINEKGLLQADPENYAHFLFAGTTGSWKTRGGMRVVVTCALASGWQVIIAGKQLDYKVFEQHPNAHLVPFSLLKDPVRAIELLRGVYTEIERRDRQMSYGGFSLWSQTSRPQTLVVVDEFSNLSDALEDIDPLRRKELWRWARMDTAEARKYGIHMAYALQDPTAQSIDLRIRRNTTPITFRVKDAASSRTLLNTNGAEMLSARHFLASMVKLERGAAFAPTDEEILQFLNAHPAGTTEQPDWIEGVLAHQPNLPEAKQDLIAGPDQHPPANEIARMAEEIRNRWNPALKKSEVSRLLGKEFAGTSWVSKVNQVIEYLISTTTPTTTDNQPDLGAVAG